MKEIIINGSIWYVRNRVTMSLSREGLCLKKKGGVQLTSIYILLSTKFLTPNFNFVGLDWTHNSDLNRLSCTVN